MKVYGLSNEITPVSIDEFKLPARRPKFSAMSNEKISKDLNIVIPDWQQGMRDFYAEEMKNLSQIKK